MKRLNKAAVTCAVLAVLILISCILISNGYEYFMKRAYPLAYTDIVAKEATENHLDPAFVYSVIKTESNFKSDALSRAGAVGLMQITPDTFEWLQTKLKSDTEYTTQDLFRPEINIRYGCKFLSLLLEKYDKRETALCAYNAGMGTVNSWLKDTKISSDGETIERIPYQETRSYVGSVLNNYQNYSKLYQFNSKGEEIDGKKK